MNIVKLPTQITGKTRRSAAVAIALLLAVTGAHAQEGHHHDGPQAHPHPGSGAAGGESQCPEHATDHAPQGSPSGHGGHGEGDGEAGHDEPPSGPHGGRLLESGDFALEVTIFERGVPPEFRLYPYRDGRPLAPARVEATVTLCRLGGRVDRLDFVPEGDYLRSQEPVDEPHSFDVVVRARTDRKEHTWEYASYEGRTTIARRIAEKAGITTAVAGGAEIEKTLRLFGRIAPDPTRVRRVGARFAGLIRSLDKAIGDAVRAGEPVATVEADDSLRRYEVRSPMAGEVIDRHANPGEVTGDGPLLTVADLSSVWAQLAVFPDQAGLVREGQSVRVRAGNDEAFGVLSYLAPTGGDDPMVVGRVVLDNRDGKWTPGRFVEAEVVTARKRVPLAVDNRAIQSFREQPVVFAKFGETYEVRMLELGLRGERFSEVTGGLEPGTEYVVGHSYLIKADIEKSGAAHSH